MKAIAKLIITEVDPRIKAMSSEELDEKIDLIYSLGYVYNPYSKEFYNHYINKGLKAIVTYNLDLDRITNLHNSLEEEFLTTNKHLRTFDEISNSIYRNDEVSGVQLFMESMSGITGVVFLLLSVILNLTDYMNFALGSMLISFFFINF